MLERSNLAGKSRSIVNGTNKTNSRKKGLRDKRYSIVIIGLLILLCSLFLWQLLSRNDVNSNNNRYTMELTRAHGAEESARMHPDNKQLYYLKRDSKSTSYQLWIKNIDTAIIKQVDTADARISKIIAVVAGLNNHTTQLFYLDKTQDSCGVFQATLTQIKHVKKAKKTNGIMQWQQTEKLFDCSDKRIKDIDYHASRKIIYYTAQPQNFWPNQIYAFNLPTEKHSFVTQVEPVGWGTTVLIFRLMVISY
ncbi:MAG: hypothetical protein HRT53_13435 [Colwellia sp.]|nr:hypothetical protein [Colwellia sp.]